MTSNNQQQYDQDQNHIKQLEQAFWQSMLDQQPQVATGMLTEPALMVSSHGINRFDHAAYTQMASDTRYKILNYQISSFEVLFATSDVAIATYQVVLHMQVDDKPMDMNTNNSTTWVKIGRDWKCAAHTETVQNTDQ